MMERDSWGHRGSLAGQGGVGGWVKYGDESSEQYNSLKGLPSWAHIKDIKGLRAGGMDLMAAKMQENGSNLSRFSTSTTPGSEEGMSWILPSVQGSKLRAGCWLASSGWCRVVWPLRLTQANGWVISTSQLPSLPHILHDLDAFLPVHFRAWFCF